MAYVHGSAAPKLPPVRIPREQSKSPKKRKKKQEITEPFSTGKSILTVLFLVIAMGVVLLSCSQYISKTNQRYINKKKIEQLRSEISELRERNNIFETSINTGVDYDYVYDIATKELGMVYPKDNQILKYPHGESEWVIQFKEIPK